VTYRLVIDLEAAKVVAEMDEMAHELFVLAALDLPDDPHRLGRVLQSEGAFTRCSYALGGLGLILYVIDEGMSTVTVTDIIWTG
jgi:hypothetical protein